MFFIIVIFIFYFYLLIFLSLIYIFEIWKKKKEYNDRIFFFYNGKGFVDLVLLGGIYLKNYLLEKYKYFSL